jgi:hypothetical protein
MGRLIHECLGLEDVAADPQQASSRVFFAGGSSKAHGS